MVLAHLMKTDRISLVDAYKEVHSKRGGIEPNVAFLGTLLKIEKELLGYNTNLFEVHGSLAPSRDVAL